jgi:hypothetical protein
LLITYVPLLEERSLFCDQHVLEVSNANNTNDVVRPSKQKKIIAIVNRQTSHNNFDYFNLIPTTNQK